MSWINADGLEVLTHRDQGDINDTGGTLTSVTNQFVFTIEDASTIGSAAVAPSALDAFIPAGAYITKAYLIVEEAFTSGGSATLTLGTVTGDGTVIDADGIDAAIALSVIDAGGDVVVHDGAQVAGTTTVGASNAYLSPVYGTAAFTGGKGKVVVEFVTV